MCACRGGRGVCEALGVGGGRTGKEGRGVGLGERVRVASPRAVGPRSARPFPRAPRLASPLLSAPPLAPGWGGGGLARPRAEGGSPGGSRLLGAGGASRSWKRVFCLLLSIPRAWSCRFQEEELRGTSRGSGATRGARLSSAPSLLALPRLPWLWRSLERLLRTGGREGSWPQSRWTPLQTPELPAAACFAATTLEEGAWEGKTLLSFFLSSCGPPWKH